jgi:UDP-glucuronate 4-epimerase
MKILITGAAGFIGYKMVKVLSDEGAEIVGLDSINDYYDVDLKYARLADTGIIKEEVKDGILVQSHSLPGYRFVRMDLTDREGIDRLFRTEGFTHVLNLAGQAGVRYSIENPYSYVQSNVVGFLNILEGCRHHGLPRLVYASSSSVYGMDPHVPFKETDRTDSPVSLYAATKKSEEAMSYAYSKLYHLQTVGLRFFTVYGPWGRPDMAPYKFMKAIDNDEEIQVFNHGDMLRDFTYIDDITEGIRLVLHSEDKEEIPYRIYNIGNSEPVKLLDFIHTIEEVTGRKAKMRMLGMQPGDVVRTYADTTLLQHDFGYKPSTTIADGIRNLYEWYKKFYK